MKKSALLIAAFATLALGGCGWAPDGGNSFTGTYLRPVEVTEAVINADGTTDTYVTKISYDENVLVSREVTTKNDATYRELKDFTREVNNDGDLVETRTRVTTADDGSSVSHTLVSTHGVIYDDTWLETKFEVFTTATTPELIESREVEYNDDRQVRYQAWTPEGGTVLRTGYNYSSASKPILTYQETVSKDGTVSNVNVGLKSMTWGFDQFKPIEYELYRDVPSLDSWDGDRGVLVEKRSDYNIENGVETWTVYKYDGRFDAEGKPIPVSTSRVTVRNQNISVSW